MNPRYGKVGVAVKGKIPKKYTQMRIKLQAKLKKNLLEAVPKPMDYEVKENKIPDAKDANQAEIDRAA